jgi:glycosyltransferase involved in cell wall biosynthesis
MIITVDVRLFQASGIGTYLQNLLPKLIPALPSYSFALIGNPNELINLQNSFGKQVKIISSNTAMYSVKEQLELPHLIPKETTLFWSPHYNIPIFYRGRLLVTVHDVFHLAMPQYVGGWHKRAYAKLLFARLRQQASSILTVSEFSKQELLRLAPAGKQPITVTHLGVDEDWFHVPSKQPLHARPYIIFVGNVKPHKNIRGLLEAFTLVHKTIPHDLVIVGKREGFIKQAGVLGSRVVFTGRVSDEQLKQYVARANALVLPSFYEGFGLPPLEAMACGCPVIVSKAASLPEVCGDAALYVDPYKPENIAAQLLRLVNDKPLQDELKQKGLARARQFSWDKCAKETLQVIQGVLERPTR